MDPSVCRHQPRVVSPEEAVILQGPGQGHGGPSSGPQSRRKCEQGILIEREERRSFHREVSVRSKSRDSWCHQAAKKLSRELLFLVNQPLPWGVVMETGRQGLDREPVRVSWVVKGCTCSGGWSCQPCRILGRWEGLCMRVSSWGMPGIEPQGRHMVGKEPLGEEGRGSKR